MTSACLEMICAAPPGFGRNFLRRHPALKRWAKIILSLRDSYRPAAKSFVKIVFVTKTKGLFLFRLRPL